MTPSIAAEVAYFAVILAGIAGNRSLAAAGELARRALRNPCCRGWRRTQRVGLCLLSHRPPFHNDSMRWCASLVAAVLLLPMFAGPSCALPAGCPMAAPAGSADNSPCHTAPPTQSGSCCCLVGGPAPTPAVDGALLLPPVAVGFFTAPLPQLDPLVSAPSCIPRPAPRLPQLDRLSLFQTLLI